jgi:predicted Fe-Mo cluster-binding NifX family protein
MQHLSAEVKLKVAIPQFAGAVAPCFEAAGNIMIANVENSLVTSSQAVKCVGPEGYRRVRLLQVPRVNILICNGIRGFYRDMLAASGVTVYQNVSAPVENALEQFLAGKLAAEAPCVEELTESCNIPHQDLIYWARELFESHGYSVTPGPDQDHHLIDLVAEIRCPVCGGQVRVAICCGAHTYRATQEITEFHHAAPLEYNARVFVCPVNPTVARYCREYGIELVNPDFEGVYGYTTVDDKLPILRERVRDHEEASWS